MFLFAHTGITLGAAMLAQGAVLRCSTNKNPDDGTKRKLSLSVITKELTRNIDIRFLIIGSLLPDIIDKPLGAFHFGDGRSIAHTLLFFLVFITAELLIYLKNKNNTGMVISAGILTHLILDSMWRNTKVLIWPFNGSHFIASNNTANWFNIWAEMLVKEPKVYIGEAIGFLILAYFVWWLVKQKKVTKFIKNGRL